MRAVAEQWRPLATMNADQDASAVEMLKEAAKYPP